MFCKGRHGLQEKMRCTPASDYRVAGLTRSPKTPLESHEGKSEPYVQTVAQESRARGWRRRAHRHRMADIHCIADVHCIADIHRHRPVASWIWTRPVNTVPCLMAVHFVTVSRPQHKPSLMLQSLVLN